MGGSAVPKINRPRVDHQKAAIIMSRWAKNVASLPMGERASYGVSADDWDGWMEGKTAKKKNRLAGGGILTHLLISADFFPSLPLRRRPSA